MYGGVGDIFGWCGGIGDGVLFLNALPVWLWMCCHDEMCWISSKTISDNVNHAHVNASNF